VHRNGKFNIEASRNARQVGTAPAVGLHRLNDSKEQPKPERDQMRAHQHRAEDGGQLVRQHLLHLGKELIKSKEGKGKGKGKHWKRKDYWMGKFRSNANGSAKAMVPCVNCAVEPLGVEQPVHPVEPAGDEMKG
jgi:hypothetical protein